MIAPKIFVIHENQQWTDPLAVELERCSVPYELWFLDEGLLDLSVPPPPGIFYSRMSASSHTRDHRFAAEYTGCVLRWLEAHERVVLNGSRALQLEISKVAQYTALEASGIRTPRTLATAGTSAMLEAARQFNGPFITKHNRGGKGLGVHKFDDVVSLQRFVAADDYESPVDGVTLIQAYVKSPQPFITRCEFVGGKFLYAVKVNTESGFELCPADVCDPTAAACPSDASAPFQIIENFTNPLIAAYERFLRVNEIDIAGIEFIVDRDGNAFTYDINTNTNYNSSAETLSGRNGMAAIASHLASLLAEQVSGPASLRFAG
jgi:hypothetical protein